MVIPANIRFAFYPTKKAVQLENKFAAMSLKVPLTPSMPEAYVPVKKVTKLLRGAITDIYANYAMSFWSGKLVPRFLTLNGIEAVSDKFTLAFSNTPGPLKPFIYKNP